MYYSMNITKAKLRSIIIEEIETALQERCHNPDNGYFEKCKEGSSTYSQTKGSNRYSSDYDGRGTYRGRKEDGKPKLSAKYGSNGTEKDSAGRLLFSTGEELDNPKYYAGDRYKKQYLDEMSNALQAWVASQDGNSTEEEELTEDNECNCSAEKKQAYLKGQQAVMYWISQYETAKTAKKKS